ncbi:MAG TPA: hypothetical protein DD435_06000 [Cyanobacteria bacterium UBA8530]|nr:hypothetical protein [Cyanobacteria bacterium UBA8530]
MIGKIEVLAESLFNRNNPVDAIFRYYFIHHDPMRRTVKTFSDGPVLGMLAECETDLDPEPLVLFAINKVESLPLLLRRILAPKKKYFIVSKWEQRTAVLKVVAAVDESRYRIFAGDRNLFKDRPLPACTRFEEGGFFGYRIAEGADIHASARIRWMAESFAGVTAFTESEHRGKGYSQACLGTLTKKLHMRGVLPLYPCEAGNEDEVKLLSGLGYHSLEKDLYVCHGGLK